MPTTRIRTTGLDHVHIYVRDMARLLDLFERLFECDTTQPSEVAAIGSFTAQIRFPAGDSAPYLDVFEPADIGGVAAKTIERRGETVGILSFRVEDIDAAAEHAAACGLREISRVGYPGVMRQVQFHPADIPGFMLELVQYEPDADERIADIQRRKLTGAPIEGLRVRPTDHEGA